MLVAIHQPEHLPWLGFFEKMQRADLFVLLDDVQFSKGDFQNRNRVKGSAAVQWLTVPVVQRFPQKINEVEIAGDDWRQKHWKTLVSCYARSPHFESLVPVFTEFYRRRWDKLATLNVAAIRLLARLLNVEKKIVLSSELNVGGQKSDLVLNICKQVGAGAYYSGAMGRAYLNRGAFQQAGIEIVVQSFNHPTYQQLFMKQQGFVPNLSVLDLLFNCGVNGLDLVGAANRKAAAEMAVVS
jgi:WbqC-like protein family